VSSAGVDISHDRLDLGPAGEAIAVRAQVVGGLGFVAAVVLALMSGADGQESFFRGYIANFTFFMTITLGGLFFVILQHLTRAGWSVVVRRIAENISGAVPLMTILALPILVPILSNWPAAIHEVYPWTDSHKTAHGPLHHKAPYLNAVFFGVRYFIYFGAWLLIAGYFRAASLRQDETGDPDITARLQTRSAPSMLVFALTLTFFAFDTLMSLSPTWFSTIFGVYVFAGGNIAAFAVMALVMHRLQSTGRLVKAVSTEHFHDVGKLMFAFVVFWAYIGFSQYMLIWYANIPEETAWYSLRQQGVWLSVTLLLLFGHFIAPFLCLISRWPKRNPGMLIVAAVWMLAMHWIDHVWLVFPHSDVAAEIMTGPAAGHRVVPTAVAWTDVAQALACLVGIGGFWVATVARKMGSAALIPKRDPRLAESLAFENI
jgi:hypothetical protein